MTFCHGRRNVPRATLTMTKSHGLKIGWDMHVFMQFCARPNTKILALHSCELRQKQCALNVA